ncbi:MAG TPA: alginate lyase family protein [Pyrinomonadaceae bacterium]|nr:alginate lyase family protein [Pyrinomonadaceae bacterium]
MASAFKKLKSLRGRSLDELRVRGTQAFAARAERRGLSRLARVPPDAEFLKLLDAEFLKSLDADPPGLDAALLEQFRRTPPSFFASFGDINATLAAWRQYAPGSEGKLIERARRVAEGKFDLLGLRGLSFGDPPDWHLEPVANRRAPLAHWSLIDYLDPSVAGDKKVIWELNRHQHFMTLGRAYAHTGDEAFAEVFARHADDWMRRNPPKLGINWASSLEVAFRAISWLWALHFFRRSPRLAPELFARLLKFLYLHARHLETYLSTYFSPNTHLTGEALGLFYLGTSLPQFRRAARWRETGARVMLGELDRHVRPDGVYFEQSTYYQRYTADFYTHLHALARASGRDFGEHLTSKLTALLDHLMHATRPDGTTAFFGDDDGGRLAPLDERAGDDFRPALATGAALFGRGDYKHVAGDASEETLWLLGAEGLAAFARLDAREPERTSRAFNDGGFYVMRDGWTPASNFLMLDCGPHGSLNCGHAHADALSFVLSAEGRNVLVDPGTYTYTGSPADRDRFRSSPAHNTLTVGGESSSVPDGPFTWKTVARAHRHAWLSEPRFDFFEGSHDGYARLSPPAEHRRAVLFLRGDYWVVRDRVASAGEHACELHFHFAPDAAPRLDSRRPDADAAAPALRERREGAAGLDVYVSGGGGAWRESAGEVSACYGAKTPAPVFTYAARAAGAAEFYTFLLPRAADESAPSLVREVEAAGGRAFELMTDDVYEDLLLTRDGAASGEVRTARVATDFAWAWARFVRATGALLEVVLIDGTFLRLDGREVFPSRERVAGVALAFGVSNNEVASLESEAVAN